MKIKCECGGSLRPAILREYDFSAEAGLPVVLRDVPGLRCGSCGGETLDGRAVGAGLRLLALAVVRLPERLDARAARYLRKYLGLTQEALAERMGINRVTVADWERGEAPLSTALDHVLRGLTVARLVGEMRVAPADVADALATVRTRPRSRRTPPIRIADVRRRIADAA